MYELHLWRDSGGIFGQLLSPVLDADSPASRLYDAQLDAKSGAVTFAARFPDGERQFIGTLHGNSVTGVFKHAGRSEAVVLRKLRADHVRGASQESYTSRAQFECAMILFRRY